MDTGSTVSTISRKIYNEYLSDTEIQPLSCILNIECADGNHLPDDGVIEADVDFSETAGSGTKVEACMFLVVPESTYDSSAPVLV